MFMFGGRVTDKSGIAYAKYFGSPPGNTVYMNYNDYWGGLWSGLVLVMKGWWGPDKINMFGEDEKYSNLLYTYLLYLFWFIGQTILWNIFATFFLTVVMSGYAEYQQDKKLAEEIDAGNDPEKKKGTGVNDILGIKTVAGLLTKPKARDRVVLKKLEASLKASKETQAKIQQDRKDAAKEKTAPKGLGFGGLLGIPEEAPLLEVEGDVEIELGEVIDRGSQRSQAGGDANPLSPGSGGVKD